MPSYLSISVTAKTFLILAETSSCLLLLPAAAGEDPLLCCWGEVALLPRRGRCCLPNSIPHGELLCQTRGRGSAMSDSCVDRHDDLEAQNEEC